jgi:hypothetical protein
MLNSQKPVIRWIKGDGLDDPITRAAIGQATRLFGDRVQYCLAANGIPPDRARRVLEWAAQPVELWMQSPKDNPELASALQNAGCAPNRFGYWWKWFPARICPDAPEMVLDGDMILVRKPSWFARWTAGAGEIRVTADPRCGTYGQYKDRVDDRRLYSGLLCFPPRFDFHSRLLSVLRTRPLASGHDGTRNTSEQGCVAAAFHGLEVHPIPLCELPFARAFETTLDYGPGDAAGTPWGYHFGRAFSEENRHFTTLVKAGEVYHRTEEVPAVERLAWLREYDSAPRPLSSDFRVAEHVADLAGSYCGRTTLVMNAGRGYLAALLWEKGCRVIAVSSHPSAIRANLAGMAVEILTASRECPLPQNGVKYGLIVADTLVRTAEELRALWDQASPLLQPSGELLAPFPGPGISLNFAINDGQIRVICAPQARHALLEGRRPSVLLLRKP